MFLTYRSVDLGTLNTATGSRVDVAVLLLLLTSMSCFPPLHVFAGARHVEAFCCITPSDLTGSKPMRIAATSMSVSGPWGLVLFSCTLHLWYSTNVVSISTTEGPWEDVMRLIGQAHMMLHERGVMRVQTDIRVGTR